jgi:hypothetical protein
MYRCSIIEDGKQPKFQVVAADETSSACTVSFCTPNNLHSRKHCPSAYGPDFFGLGHHTSKHLIQELPGAKVLKDYLWQCSEEAGSPSE